MFAHISDPNQKEIAPLPYTAKFPCVLRGDLHRLSHCPASFYAVGKILKNGWRRDFHIPMPNGWGDYLNAQPVRTHYGFTYAGPFFVRCDHGCAHTTESHATASCSDWNFRPSQIFHRSNQQIQQAGFVLVWCGLGEDTLATAYGSLVEIGVAYGSGKPILLAHHPKANLRDFWFAVETASAVVCAESPLSALQLLYVERSRR